LVGIDSIMLSGVNSMLRVAVPESPTKGLKAWANRAAWYMGVLVLPP
jgi:hypothetical protein